MLVVWYLIKKSVCITQGMTFGMQIWTDVKAANAEQYKKDRIQMKKLVKQEAMWA